MSGDGKRILIHKDQMGPHWGLKGGMEGDSECEGHSFNA